MMNEKGNDMLLHSEDTKQQNDRIVRQFIDGFMDTRKREFRYLKKLHQSCQQLVEERISQTPDLEYLLSLYKDDRWVQELLIAHILLKIYHQAASWGMETLQLKPALKVQYKKRRYYYLNRRSPDNSKN
jgi:hypothetical protein